MALANLDLVRSIYADWERGDYSSIAEWAHPDIEFVVADGPEPGSWMGLTGMTEAGRDFLSAWEEYRTEVDEYRELDDERVLVLLRRRGRGKTSGLELGQMTAKGAGRNPWRRRTSTSCDRSMRLGTAATSVRRSGRTPRSSSLSPTGLRPKLGRDSPG